MEGKPDFERGIYRVTCVIIRDGNSMVATCDLVFQEGAPLLVLDWLGDRSAQTLKLDPARLVAEPTRPGFYVYDGMLVDPRDTH